MSSPVSSPAGTSGAWPMTGASAPMPPQNRMSNLFAAIDTQKAGAITQVQLNSAFQTLNPPANFKAFGADNLWNALDPNKSGSVSRSDFVSTMTGLMTSLRGYAAKASQAK